MTSYPHDEFDDIDEDTAPRGAYRGGHIDSHTSNRGLLLTVLCGVLSLLVGGFMYVNSPRLASPEAAASASAASASPSAEATPTTDPSSVTVEVYNSSAAEGAANVATKLIESKGYTVTATGNWAGAYMEESSVNFATGASSEANDIADALGLPLIAQDYQAAKGNIYVVLGADFDAEALASKVPAAQQTPDATPSASPSASASQTLYVVDPATGSYVEATDSNSQGQTLYTYDPATGYTPYSGQQNGAGTVTYSYDPVTGTYQEDPAGSFIYDSATGTYIQK
ncbi:MAG: LytR C-terminal domain-containing protein [Rothia sp. (in: high G+C Gram-positive bacteria)]|nr:LytR C-terminal domain-containing protein [Rothia sp. (in: high G+C Gram-positive bacteria)]